MPVTKKTAAFLICQSNTEQRLGEYKYELASRQEGHWLALVPSVESSIRHALSGGNKSLRDEILGFHTHIQQC